MLCYSLKPKNDNRNNNDNNHPDGRARCAAFMLELSAVLTFAVGIAVSVRMNDLHATRVAEGAT
jgi:hypothetical protein